MEMGGGGLDNYRQITRQRYIEYEGKGMDNNAMEFHKCRFYYWHKTNKKDRLFQPAA